MAESCYLHTPSYEVLAIEPKASQVPGKPSTIGTVLRVPLHGLIETMEGKEANLVPYLA